MQNFHNELKSEIDFTPTSHRHTNFRLQIVNIKKKQKILGIDINIIN